MFLPGGSDTMLKSSVGLEIVNGTLRIAAIGSLFGRRRLRGTFEIPDFESLSPDDRRRRLRQLFKANGLSTSSVHLALAHGEGVVRQLRLPAEVRDKLDDVVRLQVEGLSPWPLDQVCWNFGTSAGPKRGEPLTVTVVIVPRTVVEARAAFFRESGLPLGGITVSGAAWAGGAATLWGAASPILVLGCESSGVDGVAVSGGRFFSTSDARSDTVAAARSVTEQLLSRGRISDPEAVRIVIHGARAESVPDSIPIELPIEGATPAATVRFGAVASALAGLADKGAAPNVLPLEMRHRLSPAHLVPTYVLAALILLGLAALGLREPYQNSVYAALLEDEIAVIAPQVADVADREAALLAAEERFAALAGHLSATDRNLEVLETLATLLPRTDWLSSYAADGNRITIEGMAVDPAAVRSVLENSPEFRDVQLDRADAEGSFTMTLTPGVQP